MDSRLIFRHRCQERSADAERAARALTEQRVEGHGEAGRQIPPRDVRGRQYCEPSGEQTAAG